MARDAIQGYMAISQYSKPGRSNIFPPTIHALLYSRISTEAANVPQIEYKSRKGSSAPKMKWINAARENAERGDGNMRPPALHLWYQQNIDKILFGVGFRYLTYLLQKRYVTVMGSDGKPHERLMVVYDDIWDECLDFFNVGVSRDMLPGMFQGRACYFDKFYPKKVFMEKFDTEFYQNIRAVARQEWFDDSDFIRVRIFNDLYEDLFYVQACQQNPWEGPDLEGRYSVPIRNDWIRDYGVESRPKKFLPVTSIHNDVNFDMQDPNFLSVLQAGRQFQEAAVASTNKTFWSKSDPTLTKALIGALNVLWRAGIDNTKASSVHFLTTESTGVYDQIRTADLYGVVPLKNVNKDGFDVKSLLQNSDFIQKWQGADEMIKNVIKYSTGNDFERAASEMTNEKATLGAIKQQVQRVRSALNAKFNESGPIPRHYHVLLNLIQQYYTEPTEMELAGEELPPNTPEELIIRNSEGAIVGYNKLKEIPYKDDLVEVYDAQKNTHKLVAADSPEAEGLEPAKSFPGRKEYLVTEEEVEIYVEPESSFAELKALDRAQEMEKLNTYMSFLGIVYPSDKTDAAGAPVMEPLIPKEGAVNIVRQFAELWGDDPDKVIPSPDDLTNIDDQKMPPPFGFAAHSKPNLPVPSPQQSGPPVPASRGPASPTGPTDTQGLVRSMASSLASKFTP